MKTKEVCINGYVCKVTFEEEMSFPEICLGRWDGSGSEVDTEASSDEGSLGASLCDSVDSAFGAAGEGGVGDAGGGRMGNEETVQGKLDLGCLEHKLHEGVVQEHLRWPLNVHGSFSCSKIEKVESTLNVELALPNETVAADEKAGRDLDVENVGEGVIKCNRNDPIGCVSKVVGAVVHEEGAHGAVHAGCGPSSHLKENFPLFGCLERRVMSGIDEDWAINGQLAHPKTLKRDSKSMCLLNGGNEDATDGFDSVQPGFVSRVEDSLKTNPSMDELEQSGPGWMEKELMGCLFSLINDHPKTPVIHGLIGNGPADIDKLEDEEEARRIGVTSSRECGRKSPPGLGAGSEGCVEGGDKRFPLKGRLSGLVGEVEGKHP